MKRFVHHVLLLFVLLAFAVSGCEKGSSGQQDDTGAKPTASELPPLELKDDTPDLLLTWIDDKGDFHVVQKISDVPEKARQEVRVVVTSRPEGTGKLVYVANLEKKGPDGSYSVKSITRAAWDEKGASKRKARLEALAPSAVAAAPSGSAPETGEAPPVAKPGQVVAIIYGAEWCKPCHDAARYLKQRGVLVVHKDIEENEVAAREMKAKLARAHMPSASIPVIDVMGQILVGFSPRALERAIESAQNAKTL